VLPITLPPLRQHPEDVPALVAFYLDSFNREFRKSVKGASPAAMKQLQQYGWPGNIRELRNAVERAMLLTGGDWLEPADFPLAVPTGTSADSYQLPAHGVNLEALEHSLVLQALERCGGNQTRAAALLGINRDQIRYRIEKYGLAKAHQA
jgi:DNA-binding NtrC family response regulator